MTGKNKSPIESIGSSAFWIMMISLALGGLLALIVWSYPDSLRGVILATIFLFFLIVGLILSRFKVFTTGTWGTNCLSFTLGFLIWAWIGVQSKTVESFSLFTVSQNNLYATIVGTIPQSLDFVMNSIVIPIAEEMFWLFGITFTLITLLRILGKKYDIFNNIFVQIGIVSLISGVTFAIFHFGRDLAFGIAAVIFRTILAVLILGDIEEDLIPWISLGFAFGFGAHIGNNTGVFGLSNAIIVLNSQFWVYGWIIYAFFGIIFITALNEIFMLIKRGLES